MNQLVLDLETKHSFDEVGGRHLRAELGVSIVGVYHYKNECFNGYSCLLYTSDAADE